MTTPQVSSITDFFNKGEGGSNFEVMAEYIPFISEGQVRYDNLNKQPQATSMNILRDTVAAQSLILHGAMPHIAVNGETVFIKGELVIYQYSLCRSELVFRSSEWAIKNRVN